MTKVETKAAVLFATTNAGKLAELRRLVGDALRVLSLADFPGVSEPLEDGATFAANAIKKAVAYSQATSLPALADDSGLCVDSLEGRPGVHSARYAEGDDAARVRKLLGALTDVRGEARTARFRCALCLALPSGERFVEEGECAGLIALAPRGSNGFGYDPVFELAPSGRTMAELSPEEKGAVSHRARAFQKMKPHLEFLAASRSS